MRVRNPPGFDPALAGRAIAAAGGARIHTVTNLVSAYWAACFFQRAGDSLWFESKLRKLSQLLMTHRYKGKDLPRRFGKSCAIVETSNEGKFVQIRFEDGKTEACLASEVELLEDRPDTERCKSCAEFPQRHEGRLVDGLCLGCRLEIAAAREDNKGESKCR